MQIGVPVPRGCSRQPCPGCGSTRCDKITYQGISQNVSRHEGTLHLPLYKIQLNPVTSWHRILFLPQSTVTLLSRPNANVLSSSQPSCLPLLQKSGQCSLPLRFPIVPSSAGSSWIPRSWRDFLSLCLTLIASLGHRASGLLVSLKQVSLGS